MLHTFGRVFALLCVLGAVSACEEEDKLATMDECESTFYYMSEKDTGGEITCKLEPDCTQYSGLFGSNPFLVNGGPCTAAIHAGLLKDKPIAIKIEFFKRTDEQLTGGTKNGIETAEPTPQPDAGTMLVRLSAAE